MDSKFKDTLDSKSWRAEFARTIIDMFPKVWTHIDNINIEHVQLQLRLLNVDLQTPEDFSDCLTALERERLILRQSVLIRRGRYIEFKEDE